MKTIKRGLLGLLLLAGFVKHVNAQAANGTIDSSVTIQTQLVWSTPENIVFGNVPAGDIATINPVTGAKTNASVGSVGKVGLTGQVGSTFKVTFTPVVTLTRTESSETIFLHLNVAQDALALGTRTSGGIPSYNGVDILTFGTDGAHSFFLGGTLSGDIGNSATVIPVGQAVGLYQGTLTLTAEYN